MLKIFQEHIDSVIPTKSRGDDAGYDLYSIKEVTILPGERQLVPIGLRIVCPKGYFYTFAPRSGLAFKHNIIPSHFNIMDSNYTGNCDVLMLNRGTESYTIQRGDRFCQLIIHEIPKLEISKIDSREFAIEVEARKERGSDGFGSSGK